MSFLIIVILNEKLGSVLLAGIEPIAFNAKAIVLLSKPLEEILLRLSFRRLQKCDGRYTPCTMLC
jgi:hypothetical protein